MPSNVRRGSQHRDARQPPRADQFYSAKGLLRLCRAAGVMTALRERLSARLLPRTAEHAAKNRAEG